MGSESRWHQQKQVRVHKYRAPGVRVHAEFLCQSCRTCLTQPAEQAARCRLRSEYLRTIVCLVGGATSRFSLTTGSSVAIGILAFASLLIITRGESTQRDSPVLLETRRIAAIRGTRSWPLASNASRRVLDVSAPLRRTLDEPFNAHTQHLRSFAFSQGPRGKRLCMHACLRLVGCTKLYHSYSCDWVCVISKHVPVEESVPSQAGRRRWSAGERLLWTKREKRLQLKN